MINNFTTDEKYEITIGLAIFNGSEYIQEALDSLLNQSLKPRIIISDNNSTDNTGLICNEYLINNSNIEYYRQDKNIGMWNNYKFVLSKANTKYFAWASHDDIWDSNFLNECYNNIIKFKDDTNIASFCKIQLIDKNKYKILVHDSNTFYKSYRYKIFNEIRYLCLSETSGKANLMYSLFTTTFLKKMLDQVDCIDGDNFLFYDLTLVYKIVQNGRFVFSNNVLIQKRLKNYIQPSNKNITPFNNFPHRKFFPISISFKYLKYTLINTDSKFKRIIIFFIMIFKIVINIFDFILKKIKHFFK